MNDFKDHKKEREKRQRDKEREKETGYKKEEKK